MSEYHFGTGKGFVATELARKVESIAEKHGAAFTRTVLPGDGPCYWFSCPNRGFPFDGDTRRKVLAALSDAGIALPGRTD